MLQDFPRSNIATSFGSARVLWTLSIEWWIYIFVGSLVFLFKTKNPLLLVLLLISFYIPMYNFFGGRGNGLFMAWIFGSFAYLVFFKTSLLNFRTSSLIFIFCSLFLLSLTHILVFTKYYDPLFFLVFTSVVTFGLFIFLKINISQKIKSVIRFFASYSYSLYLLHYSILDFFTSHFQINYFYFISSILISNIIALLFALVFEIKFTKYIRFKLNHISLNCKLTKLFC